MSLTPQQLATLKADILASPDLAAQPMTNDGAFAIAAAYKLPAQPDFWVWSTLVQQDSIMQNGFDWLRVDNLTVGKARIWEWLFANPQRAINPSKANVRAGIGETWKGTAADNAVRLAVFQHCQRLANRAEKLFAVGDGTSTTVDGIGPATMTFEGSLQYTDVVEARQLP
jgi:hypothetical protein